MESRRIISFQTVAHFIGSVNYVGALFILYISTICIIEGSLLCALIQLLPEKIGKMLEGIL